MIIYKITNLITNKHYIGQTVRPLQERYAEHINRANNLDSRHLYVSMRKYGIDNFTIEQIDTANSIQDLNEKEIYWISYYDSYNNGYNMTQGGDINPMHSSKSRESHKSKMRSEEVRNKISESVRRNRADPNSNYNTVEYHEKLSLAAKGNQKYKGKKRPQHAIEASSKALRKKVKCVDLNSTLVAEFDSVKAAADWWYQNGYSHITCIYNLCNVIKKSATKDIYIKDLKWIYE